MIRFFFPYNVIQNVLRQHRFFPVECCMEPLGQDCTRYLPVKCCPKCINTILNSIRSCAILFGASWTTLHKNITCPVLYQGYQANIQQFFLLVTVVWSLLGNIAPGFYLWNVVPIVLRQHSTELLSCAVLVQVSCTRNLLVHCCLKSIKPTLNIIFFSAMLSRASRTTLHKNLTCAVLTQGY